MCKDNINASPTSKIPVFQICKRQSQQWKVTIVRSLKHWIDNSDQELIVYVSYSHTHEISLTGIINH